MKIFYALFVLTVLEVGAAYLNVLISGFPLWLLGLILIVLAVVKAALVGMYFMHLKFEKRTLGIIALTPMILCTLLIIALLPDLTGSTRKSEPAAAAEQVEQQ